MYVTKFKPANEIFRDSITPFGTFFDTFFNDRLGKVENNTSFFRPSVDVKETETSFELAFTLPGLDKEDVKIELKDNRLTVSGERKMEKEENNTRYHRVENHYGSFSRSFMLPENVNADAIEAGFKNGILTLTLPKTEQVGPKTISIK